MSLDLSCEDLFGVWCQLPGFFSVWMDVSKSNFLRVVEENSDIA